MPNIHISTSFVTILKCTVFIYMLYYNTKAKKIMLISLISAFLAVSCHLTVRKEDNFNAFVTLGGAHLPLSERLVEINLEDFSRLYEAGWPLVFYVSAKHCKYVSDIEPYLYHYLETTNLLLFNFDVSSEAWVSVRNRYSGELRFLGTPTFYFWQKDKYAHKITGTSTLATSELFQKTFSEHLQISNTKVSWQDTIQIDDMAAHAQIKLDLTNIDHLDILLNTLLPALGNKRNLYVINSQGPTITITLSNGARYIYTEAENTTIVQAIKDYVTV